MKRGRSLGFVVVYTPPKEHETVVLVLQQQRQDWYWSSTSFESVMHGVLMNKAQAERTAHTLQAERKDPFYQVAELVLPPEPEVEI